MSFLGWILLGLVAGFLGSKIVNSSGQGMLLDIALGIVGAIVGGLVFSTLLTLYVVPAVYLIFDGLLERSRRRKEAPHAALAPAEAD